MSALDEIQKGESKTLEFKESLQNAGQIAKTVVAFSNGAGGRLIIGVKDRTFEIIGITDEDVIELPDRVSNIIYDMCYPTIIPEIYVENIDGRNLLVIKIYPGNLKPYYIKSKGKIDGTYIRVGASNRLADEEMILELERQRRNVSFDEEAFYDYKMEEIDFDTLKSDFFKYTGRSLSDNDLFTLRLLREENGAKYSTRACVLLAGKKNTFEYARIKCARFKGTDTEEFIDQKDFDGPLYTQIENAMNFAKVYIAKSGRIAGLQRQEQYEVPLIAIREALANAVVHRDYSISGSDIKFAIFDDRIEITSPGLLPKTISIEDIMIGRSEIRNKVIARFFKEIGFIEQWGTGIRKINASCIDAGLEAPVLFETGLFFKVVIFKRQKSSDKVAISSDKVAISSDKVAISSDKEKLVLDYLRLHKTIANNTAREVTDLSSAGARKLLSGMVEKELIKAVGEKKSRHYILNS